MSTFWDPLSNNQAVRTQGASLDNLFNMIGLEFVVDPNPHEPSLFIIKKQRRSSPRIAELLDVFYVMEGVIYKTPDLLEILSSRGQKASIYTKKSFETLLESVEFTSSAGHKCFRKRTFELGDDGSQELKFKKPAVREFPSFASVLDDLASFTPL
eukprot:gene7298-14885_t